jgi:hypothetical protein
MSVLDDFARMRLYRKKAAEFQWLADSAPVPSVQRRYRVIARHYSDLADREEQADKARMAERLKQLKLQRGEATNKPAAPIYLIAAESLPLREQIRAAEQLCNN